MDKSTKHMITPYFQDSHVTIYNKSCFDMSELPDNSIQAIVTSPPYWGLRKYKAPDLIFGGNNHHEHEWTNRVAAVGRNDTKEMYAHAEQLAMSKAVNSTCSICGAWKGQYGLEPTVELYVQHSIEIMRECRRVLRPDGCMFWNVGDSYATQGGGVKKEWKDKLGTSDAMLAASEWGESRSMSRYPGLKPKDLCLIPFRVALAAQQPYYSGKIKNELDRVKMAAYIDTEGTICGFRHTRPNGDKRSGVLVFVTNSNTNLLDECDRIWPGSRYIDTLKTGDVIMGAVARHDCWRWQIQMAEQRALFLREIYPYLIAKKRQAVVAWNLNEYSVEAKHMGRGGETDEAKGKRQILAQLLTDLNQQREVDIPSWVKEPPSVLEPGFYVRSAIIWHKNNPMPESVTDRPTDAYEFIFLLAKSAKYYWDLEAIREPIKPTNKGDVRCPMKQGGRIGIERVMNERNYETITGANARNVWEFPTQPYPEAHFATFPEELPERCIKAATPEYGCCDKCGRPYERITSKEKGEVTEAMRIAGCDKNGDYSGQDTADYQEGMAQSPSDTKRRILESMSMQTKTLGWQQVCKCENSKPMPSTCLDPFGGSGTTAWVSKKLNRKAVLYEISEDYCKLALNRNRQSVML